MKHKHGKSKTGKKDMARAQRREEAEARQSIWDRLTVQQKITSLDDRLGVGVGASRQRWHFVHNTAVL
jgi:hypothetical protein